MDKLVFFFAFAVSILNEICRKIKKTKCSRSVYERSGWWHVYLCTTFANGQCLFFDVFALH